MNDMQIVSYFFKKNMKEVIMHTIKIFVKGGVVYEVDNLPDGFDYEIIDHDTEESATDWIDEKEND
jgi:hypothetical protein